MSTANFPNVDEEGQMRCLNCGNKYVSFYSVQVVFREEDAEKGLNFCVYVPGGYTVTDDLFPGNNPSARRSGIRVAFRCENCHMVTEFSLAEHKGVMFVESEIGEQDEEFDDDDPSSYLPPFETNDGQISPPT